MDKIYHAYLAGPMFSQAETAFNEVIAKAIRENFPTLDLYVPQENADLNTKDAYADSRMIFKGDTDYLAASDFVIAVVDGITIDAGAASEIGYAAAKEIPMIGLYTDTRQQGAKNQEKLAALQELGESQFHYVNLYTIGAIKTNGALVATIEEVVAWVRKHFYTD